MIPVMITGGITTFNHKNETMKKFFAGFLFLCPVLLSAQGTAADSVAIREAAYNYVGGFYSSDSVKVAKAVHPELVKRIIRTMNGEYRIANMSASELASGAKRFKKPADPNPAEPFKLDIIIYDIAQDIATIKIINNKLKFFDYAQLAKIKGEWKIINVLWAMTP